VTTEEMSSCKEVADIQFRAEKLDKKDLFGKSDPFFVFSKSMPNGQVNKTKTSLINFEGFLFFI
jgi:hypothetical protein